MPELLEVISGRTKVMLRVDFQETERAAAATKLPVTPLTSAGSDPLKLWLAPDQWLITSDKDSAFSLIRRIDDSLKGVVHSASDASAALTTFQLNHPRSAELLCMGCGLDLDRLSNGQCARSRLAQVPVVIVPLPGTVYDLYVDSSHATHFRCWMSVAASGLYGARDEH